MFKTRALKCQNSPLASLMMSNSDLACLRLLKKQQCLLESVAAQKVLFALSQMLCFSSIDVFLEQVNDLQAILIQGRDGVKMPEEMYCGRRLAMGISLYPPWVSRPIA